MSNENVKHEGMEHKVLEDWIEGYVLSNLDSLRDKVDHLEPLDRLEAKIEALFAVCLKIDARSMVSMYGLDDSKK